MSTALHKNHFSLYRFLIREKTREVRDKTPKKDQINVVFSRVRANGVKIIYIL